VVIGKDGSPLDRHSVVEASLYVVWFSFDILLRSRAFAVTGWN